MMYKKYSQHPSILLTLFCIITINVIKAQSIFFFSMHLLANIYIVVCVHTFIYKFKTKMIFELSKLSLHLKKQQSQTTCFGCVKNNTDVRVNDILKIQNELKFAISIY